MPTERYGLSVSGVVKEQLHQALHMARRAGRRQEGIKAARWIMEELERTPSEFGESREFLAAMNLQIRMAFVRPDSPIRRE